MSWVRVDDKMWSHPKFAGLSAGATRLWLFGLCWCNQQQSDGFVPSAMLRVLRGSPADAAGLVAAGLWVVGPDGWSYHDYLEYQPSRDQLTTQRNATKDRVSEFRKRARNGVTPTTGNAPVTAAPTQPNPTRTEETPVSPRAGDGSSAEVVQVFEGWKRATGHAQASLDRKRASRIKARLREKFTPEQLLQAIGNAKNDPFLMGSNDTGRVYDGLETLLRDAAQVERLLTLTKPAEPKRPDAVHAGFIEHSRRPESVVFRPKVVANPVSADEFARFAGKP
jgi:hypothetical protein